MATSEEQHEGQVKQVVEDEVGTDSSRSIDPLDVTREEVEDVAKLQDEQSNAGIFRQRCGNTKAAEGYTHKYTYTSIKLRVKPDGCR